MAQTKKLLVAFDYEKPEEASSDFLVPLQTEEQTSLYGLMSGREHEYGLMVYLGRSITENDLFAKLVDSKANIESAEDTLAALKRYVERLQSLRIGNVARLQRTAVGDFDLVVVANTPSGFRQ